VPAGRFAALRSTIAGDRDPDHRVEHVATLELLARVDEAEPRAPTWWDRFAQAGAVVAGDDGWDVTVGVMGNMVALVHGAAPSDLVAASMLVRRHGHRRVAAEQSKVDRMLGTGPSMPLATTMVKALVVTASVADRLEAWGLGRESAAEVAERCYQMAFALVTTDIDRRSAGPHLTSPAEMLSMWDLGGVPAWRAQVAIIADNPWSPYAGELRSLALAAGWVVDGGDPLDQVVKAYRSRIERRERELVAREIRQLVAVSGVSQREFAARAGTSASRLSTYVNGLVTPSATMMLRIRRVSAYVQQRRDEGV
jgi:DNA-binding transcriptional regulator YiaG